jgi:hypothetical protein
MAQDTFVSKLLLAIAPAAFGALVTGYVTNSVNQAEFSQKADQIRHDLSQDLLKALNDSHQQLNTWINRYDSLKSENAELLQQVERSKQTSRSVSRPASEPRSPKVQAQAALEGQWATPDGAAVWEFNGGKVSLSSPLLGSSGSGSYSRQGDRLRVDLVMDRFLYIPTNQAQVWEGTIGLNGKVITGTGTDGSGATFPWNLVRQP